MIDFRSLFAARSLVNGGGGGGGGYLLGEGGEV